MKQMGRNEAVRNIAIIAHVDHGKTTLVDQMFRHAGVFRSNQDVDERVMDRLDLERERGITIAAKNCSVTWRGVRINILDTPGHADFGGEVERALTMVDGAVLLVDASEGPLPQTRFVLKKALEAKLKIIVVINKIDRPDARAREVLNEVYDLFIDLDAGEEQLEFPLLYAVGREGVASRTLEERGTDLTPLFETIIEEVPAPVYDPTKPFQMLVCELDYCDYLGRLAVGRVLHGTARCKDQLVCINAEHAAVPLRVTKLQIYDGVDIREIEEVQPGDIVIISGADEVTIGDTICTAGAPRALKRIRVDEPTVAMHFSINSSPLAGREGRYVQSKKIAERLHKEALRNVAIQIEEGADGNSFMVKGRGEFQLAILLETMRREGYEMTAGRPRVVFKERNGVRMEPVEHVFIDCEESFLGIVHEKLSRRKGRMINLVNHNTGRIRVEFSVPTRGLIGYRSEFLTDTRGTGIMNAYLQGYEEYRGEIVTRVTGSLVADRAGEAVAYALYNLEPRGILFVEPGMPVYEGMIVGEHNRDNDLYVNVCKEKKLTNMRAAGKDDAILLTPVVPMTLERAIEFIKDDEVVEITPKSIRLRKAILPATKR